MGQRADLSFGQAHVAYTAFLEKRQGRSQAEVFGTLSLSDRKTVILAIEVLEQNKTKLQPALIQSLKESKPILAQGRREIAMTTRYLVHRQFLKTIEENGELYQKLVGLTNQPYYASSKKMMKEALQGWIDQLEPGEGKEAAQAAFKKLAVKIDKYKPQQGFTEGIVRGLLGEFQSEVHLALTHAWLEGAGLTKAERKAMGIDRLGWAFFSAGKTIQEKRKAFESIVAKHEKARQAFREERTPAAGTAYVQACKKGL